MSGVRRWELRHECHIPIIRAHCLDREIDLLQKGQARWRKRKDKP